MIRFENLAGAFVKPGTLPPECDVTYYQSLFPDLHYLNEQALRDHYDIHGRKEGRSGSPCDLRFAFVRLVSPSARVLEIGPFTAPTLRGPNVEYFDVLSADGLRARAKEHNYPIIEPVRIDHVSPEGDLSVVPSGFDAVYSAHCVEHTPDLISHLLEVHRILKPGGLYLMTIPDMRYTFDHFRTATRTQEIMDAHTQQRKVHSNAAIMNYYTLSTHNDPGRHWNGDHGPQPRVDLAESKAEAERMILEAKGGYVDVHTWFFDPASFRRVMSALLDGNLLSFDLARVYNTPMGSNEFNAILTKRNVRR